MGSSKPTKYFQAATLTLHGVKKLFLMLQKKFVDGKEMSHRLYGLTEELHEVLAPYVTEFLKAKFPEMEALGTVDWPSGYTKPDTREGFYKILYALENYSEYPEDIPQEQQKGFEEGFAKWWNNRTAYLDED